MSSVSAWLVVVAAFAAAAGTWFRAYIAWKDRKDRVREMAKWN